MRSAASDITYLLASRGLVFSNVTGFSPRRLFAGGQASQSDNAGGGDRSYWTAYDYFVDAIEQRAAERARFNASLRAFVSRLFAQLTRPGEGTAYTEHVAA